MQPPRGNLSLVRERDGERERERDGERGVEQREPKPGSKDKDRRKREETTIILLFLPRVGGSGGWCNEDERWR
jgi:hypothetical protein